MVLLPRFFGIDAPAFLAWLRAIATFWLRFIPGWCFLIARITVPTSRLTGRGIYAFPFPVTVVPCQSVCGLS